MREPSFENRDGQLFYRGERLPDGPWTGEPDRVEFKAHGFPCLIVRHPNMGHFCGYVAMPPGHPWHGKGYDSIDPYPDVHGGLTYADKCNDVVCHKPAPGESDDVWWLGFDAAHHGDYSPSTLMLLGRPARGFSEGWSETYKTVEYMREQCELLARQASEAK